MGRCPRLEEPRLVGEDDGLYPIAEAELAEDAGDVGLDRCGTEVELGRDLCV